VSLAASYFDAARERIIASFLARHFLQLHIRNLSRFDGDGSPAISQHPKSRALT
jgi:hypothetical protein